MKQTIWLPATKPIATASGTTVTPSAALQANPSAMSKFMSVLQAHEPVALLGVAPFIKNPASQTILVNEAPVVQALLSALKLL